MQTSSTAKEVSAIILSQLGGGRFLMMTGSKNLVFGTAESGNDFLNMKLTRNQSKANYLKIELTPMDTYTMTFNSVIAGRFTTKVIKENVYCDQLQATFTQVTGLYTSL